MSKYLGLALVIAVGIFFVWREDIVNSNDHPVFLYKILSVDQWEQSQHGDHVVLGDSDEAFIHLSEEHQVPKIAQKFFAGQEKVIVLKLKTAELPGRLVKESNPGGTTEYYHLYNGTIPLSAVAAADLSSFSFSKND